MADRSLRAFLRTPKQWYAKYPVAYAKEQLIIRGTEVVPVLWEITREKCYADVHFMAWRVLEKLRLPTYLTELYDAGKSGRLSPIEVSSLVVSFLPIRWSADDMQEDRVIDWLGAEVAHKTFDEIVLRAMDRYLTVEYADGGIHPLIIDPYVLGWLDRIYDVDLDNWLAAKAPTVYEFRRSQLAKGYDPATSFSLEDNILNRLLDEAMVAMYSHADDRQACAELLEAVYDFPVRNGAFSALQPTKTPGWLERLKNWYRTDRPLLRYDTHLLRFTSSGKDVGSRPASTVSSH